MEALVIEKAGAAFAKMFRTWGELGASSVTLRVSLRGPEKMGENVMLTVQLVFGAMVAVVQEVRELVKSAGLLPPAEIFETCMEVVPVLVIATVTGVLARPCVVIGKVTEVGRNLSAGPLGGEFIPVPIRATD